MCILYYLSIRVLNVVWIFSIHPFQIGHRRLGVLWRKHGSNDWDGWLYGRWPLTNMTENNKETQLYFGLLVILILTLNAMNLALFLFH